MFQGEDFPFYIIRDCEENHKKRKQKRVILSRSKNGSMSGAKHIMDVQFTHCVLCSVVHVHFLRWCCPVDRETLWETQS